MANTVLGVTAGKQENMWSSFHVLKTSAIYSFDKKKHIYIYFYDYSIIIMFYLKLKIRKYAFSN